jgi:hypothetical protein
VQRVSIWSDVRGSCQGASILLEVVDYFGPRLNKPLPAQELGGRFFCLSHHFAPNQVDTALPAT